ncbi:ArgE/DapE family deacylase [Salinisphaera sp. SPP-AMP-43]|uniref:M20 family metallopeptidase n=1 Tax=Salinisphaera sp. SPP-AMP-43 TaxID=3121288 RepID=UPI003C6DC4F0
MVAQQQRTHLIDEERLRERLVDLVRIPSMTGDEEAAIRRIADWLSEAGAEVDYWYDGIAKMVTDPAYPGHEIERAWIPCVAGMIRGQRPGPTILLTGHVDVVPPGDYNQWSRDPFAGVVDDDRLYGRGAADMKSGLIAALAAFETFAHGSRDFAGRVVLVAVPAEEDSGLGTLSAIRRGWIADAAIVTEPTEKAGRPELIVAHAGAMSCRIEINGLSAHASRRLMGENALDHYLAVHQILRDAEQALNAAETHPLMQELRLPYATSVGTVHGGQWSSSVMDRLEVEVRIGVTLNETTDEAKARFERTLAKGVAGHPWLATHPPRVHWRAAGFGSSATRLDHPLIDALREAAATEFGEPPTVSAAPYGCDMSAWVRVGNVPTVVYGPGDIEQAHAADEWVSLSNTARVARALVIATERLLACDRETLAFHG